MTVNTDSAMTLGSLDLSNAPLALGGNVFGWTSDRADSFAVLDGFVGGGGVLIDTADSYSAWVPGHSGGESETMIGEWLAARGRRDDVLIATKVSQHPEFTGLAAANVRAAAEASLRRLGVDTIDLYYAHFDHGDPIEETAEAFSALVDDGLVREIAISNLTAERIDAWMAVADAEGLHEPVALQPHYNLMERAFEGDLRDAATRHGLGVLPYWGLAKGFLTGKYREADGAVDSPRASQALAYLDDRGRRVLSALDRVAVEHEADVAAVALAWLKAQPTVVAPIASARNATQLETLLASMRLELNPSDLQALTEASAL
ncbi:aldo/keto reductase [Demequina capsici]|uniref:Aldo/keto reductase n=1 Tax=Demequina capsici TaxID=3075620 RepID=A0AA96J9L1_9MICO|nr:aldo/keto reductase [Demequina sp. OYTSA14]WNM23611.1 aldo/keto reductase [Demequina sp. OYTSA14]